MIAKFLVIFLKYGGYSLEAEGGGFFSFPALYSNCARGSVYLPALMDERGDLLRVHRFDTSHRVAAQGREAGRRAVVFHLR